MIRRIALASAFLALGCAGDPVARTQELNAYCQRWSAKFMAAGTHSDLDAYREDLMSTCMALKGETYQPQQTRADAR